MMDLLEGKNMPDIKLGQLINLTFVTAYMFNGKHTEK
jgi:hypothetical protein